MRAADSGDLPVLGQGTAGAYEAPDIEGWTTRTTTDEPRLSELVELYRELGFEVLLRPVVVGDAAGTCSACVTDDPGRYRTIYTRPKIED